MKHIIESQQFDTEKITEIFKAADELREQRSDQLRGKLMASLFYEPSTRTRFSFESAMHRLGGSVISTENANEFSSAAKGETLEDSIRVTSSYVDVIVLRHPMMGASARASRISPVPIINAGDGAGQHPTQALLDLYTIQREIGRLDEIHIALAGDLRYGRTVHSLAYLLGKYRSVTVTFVSPEALRIGDDIKKYLDKHNVTWYEVERWDEVIGTIDVLYHTRIQKERFEDYEEYKKHKHALILSLSDVNQMKESAIVMHPLPRAGEIAAEVDTSPRAKYFEQAENGQYIRMALLRTLLQS